jgi:hypothetical protein
MIINCKWNETILQIPNARVPPPTRLIVYEGRYYSDLDRKKQTDSEKPTVPQEPPLDVRESADPIVGQLSCTRICKRGRMQQSWA